MSETRGESAPVNFARPPVAEVALAVQFAGPVTDDQSTLNGFWPRIRHRYPELVVQPALPPMREDFGPIPGISFQFLNQPSARYWFLSSDQAEVVQVQGDRLAFNWRKEPMPGTVVGDYPRYPYVRERFAEVLTEFRSYAQDRGTLLPANWCEIAYINQIPALVEGSPRGLGSILRLVNDVPLPGLPNPEDSAFVQRYTLSRGGAAVGRFHMNANAGFKLPAQELTYVVNLTVRGLVASEEEGGIIGFMDDGRDLIVHAFEAATTDEMHAEWGLE